MKGTRLDAILPRGYRGPFLASLVLTLLIGAPPAMAQARNENGLTRQDVKEVQSEVGQSESFEIASGKEPLARIMAATTKAMLADTKAYDDALAAAEVAKLVSMDGLTPASAVLDRCDGITALADRAEAMGKRYPDYIAIARKQGEVEVAASRMQRGEVDAYVEGLAEQQPGFEQRWAATSKFTREAGGLCAVLARRHWRLNASGVLEMEEPDLAEAQHLLQSVQEVAQQMVALEQARRETAEQQVRKLLARR